MHQPRGTCERSTTLDRRRCRVNMRACQRCYARGEKGRERRGYPCSGGHTLGAAACRGDDGRRDRSTRRGGVAARARVRNVRAWCSAPAEQRTAQSAQRREERDATDSRTPVAAGLRGVTGGQLTHQRGRLGRFPLRDDRAAQHREMSVEARTGRAAPASDRRDPRPAAHCYLFHVTPHPYESTRPGQGNPIAPLGHSCIAVTGFTFPIRVLTTPP